MKTCLRAALITAVSALALAGCKNPADDVPAAAVEAAPAGPESAPHEEPAAADPAEGSAEEPAEGSADADPATAAAALGELAFDQTHGTLGFVGSKVTASHEGSFEVFSGAIRLGATVEDSKVSVEIETASLVADRPRLTQHLRSSDFFDVETYPAATFVSTGIAAAEDGFMVTGDLVLHGATRTISFPATIDTSGDTVKVAAEFSIDRQDFGIVYAGMPDDLIRDEVVIRIALDVPKG